MFKVILLILSVISASFIHAQFVSACSCNSMDKNNIEATSQRSREIFVGKVIGKEYFYPKDESGNKLVNNKVFHVKLTFQILKNLKSQSSENLDVWSSSQEAACGYDMPQGTYALIFTYNEKDSSKLRTSLCSQITLNDFKIQEWNDFKEIKEDLDRKAQQKTDVVLTKDEQLSQERWKVRAKNILEIFAVLENKLEKNKNESKD